MRPERREESASVDKEGGGNKEREREILYQIEWTMRKRYGTNAAYGEDDDGGGGGLAK